MLLDVLDARFRGHDGGETTGFFSELLRHHTSFKVKFLDSGETKSFKPANSMISALTFGPSMKIFPTATGNLKRRGPGLPGLTNNTPSFSSIVGLCE